MGEGRPKQLKARIGLGASAPSFQATHMAHAHGFDAVHKAQHHETTAPARVKITPKTFVPGGGGKAAERRRRQIEAGQLNSANGLNAKTTPSTEKANP